MSEQRYVLEASIPNDDATLEALHKWFKGTTKSFTKSEAINFITDMSEDADYAEWEFEQLLNTGAIVKVPPNYPYGKGLR